MFTTEQIHDTYRGFTVETATVVLVGLLVIKLILFIGILNGKK